MTDDATKTTISPFHSPWSLHFERDGTEDVAVIYDADGAELVRSRHFWLPEAGDPEPPTLAAMLLIAAAPALLAGSRMIIDRWERGNLAEAARACQAAVELASAGETPWDIPDAVPAGNRPYSVLLLYPDYANDSGTETFYAFVEAADAITAVAAAKRQAVAAQDGIDIGPDDFAVMLVMQGHHHGEPLFNK